MLWNDLILPRRWHSRNVFVECHHFWLYPLFANWVIDGVWIVLVNFWISLLFTHYMSGWRLNISDFHELMSGMAVSHIASLFPSVCLEYYVHHFLFEWLYSQNCHCILSISWFSTIHKSHFALIWSFPSSNPASIFFLLWLTYLTFVIVVTNLFICCQNSLCLFIFFIGVCLNKSQWFCVFVPLTNNGTYA